MSKKGLGIGLDALLGEAPAVKSRAGTGKSGGGLLVPIEFITADPDQPRRYFDEAELDELAQSIKGKGLLQPILVRPLGPNKDLYQIVAGERRWRAAQLAKLHEIPVIVRELSTAEAAEIALIENVQRVDLNPIEEAQGYLRLSEHYNRTQAQIAASVGKSRSHVANLLRLVQLSDFIQNLLVTGVLTMGHARALLGASDPEGLARQIVAKRLSVRDVERLVKRREPTAPVRAPHESKGKKKGQVKNADIKALQRDLAEALGLEVTISHRGKKGGNVMIDYVTLEQLDLICARLTATAF